MQYWKYRRMFRKLAQVFLWFFTVPLLLASSLFFIRQKDLANKPLLLSENLTIPEGLEIQTNHQQGQVLALKITDLRPFLVSNFLKNTPLAPHSELLVEAADKYNLDWRLIPAIAMKETGGGTTAKANSYNAWGFGNGRAGFNSWEEAINIVAKTLKEKYIDRGLVTPEQIMAVYAPPQLSTGGRWAKDINYFFSRLESL